MKWFVAEDDSAAALAAVTHEMLAPDLLIAECANVFWKKQRRGEMSPDRAVVNIAALARSSVRLHALPSLSAAALRAGMLLDHATHDCFYLALADREKIPFLTADGKLKRLVGERWGSSAPRILLLAEFAELSA